MRSFKGYTGVNTKEKIKRDAERMLEKSLKDAYVSSECLIAPNGDVVRKFATEVQVFQKWDSDGDVMKVIGRIGEIERGNYIYYDNQVWLIMTKPEDNGVYRKAEKHLCSTECPVKENDKVEIVGFDDICRLNKKTVKGIFIIIVFV